jgi:hypothetical protein
MAAATNILAIAKAIPKSALAALGAENLQIVSDRTARFDLKSPSKDGINRVKITHENGKFLIRTYRVEEVEIAYGLPTENVLPTIRHLIGAE